jgi:hypothetical protein
VTADLVAFLNEQLDAEERGALDAKEGRSGRWFVGDKWNVYCVEDETPHDDAETNELVVYGNGAALSAHIARHDPARVLAKITAKRAIVDAYLPPGADPHPGLPCTDDIKGDPDGEEYAEMHPADQGACMRHVEASKRLLHHDYVLRLLAAPYAGVDGYRPEWAPDA